MTLNPPHEKEQLGAIKYQLATAPKVQKQLKEKFGYGENMFFDLDLIEYRIKNSIKDIAEDLDVKSLYGLTSDKVYERSVGFAFRGYDNEEFLPEYRFEGLFGEQLNDIIKETRLSITGPKNGRKGGRKCYELGRGIHGLTAEEISEHGRKGGRKGGRNLYKLGRGIHGLTAEQHRENSRKGNLALGKHIWSLDKLVSLHEIREESVGKGFKKTQPCMNYVTEKFNEQHGTELTNSVLSLAYSKNKHRLSEAGVEIAERFIWNLEKILSLHEIREESIGKGRKKTSPCWTYLTEEFNEQHGTDFSKIALRQAYSKNKHLLSEAE